MRSHIRYSQQIQRFLYRQSLRFSRQLLRHLSRLQILSSPQRHLLHTLPEMTLLTPNFSEHRGRCYHLNVGRSPFLAYYFGEPLFRHFFLSYFAYFSVFLFLFLFYLILFIFQYLHILLYFHFISIFCTLVYIS